MRVLVTGASGRIGANLAKTLVESGHQVRGLVWDRDLRAEKLSALDVELITGSVTDPQVVARAADGVQVICHLAAAFQGGGPFTTEQYFDINVRGTLHMLEAARRGAPELEHFFYAGTDAAYAKYVPGGMQHPIVADHEPLRPQGWYALSKVLGEEMCMGYYRTYELPVTVFRFALTVAGDELLDFGQFWLEYWKQQYENKAGSAAEGVRQQFRAVEERRRCLVLARDEQGRSYKKHIADVRDIVSAFPAAMGQRAVAGQVFQLGAPRAFTWEEAVPYLAEKLDVEYIDVRLPEAVPTFYEFDLSKGQRLFGYRPQYDILSMIDDALAFRQGVTKGVIPTVVA